MSKINSLVGNTFGRLTVISYAESNERGRAMWNCKCSCGNQKIILGDHLLRRDEKGTTSCGCFQRESRTKHGAYLPSADIQFHIRFTLLQSLRDRARRRKYESDLEIEDIPEIPSVCPVLKIPLRLRRKENNGNNENKGVGKGRARSDNSPTIDRLNYNLPYLKKYKDNLFVISWRANKLKSDASLTELEAITEYVRYGVAHCERESSLIDSKPIISSAGNEAEAEPSTVND